MSGGVADERDCLRAWLALLSASNRIKKTIDARMRERFGLSLSRFDVLAALDRAGTEGFSAGMLSHHLKVTEGNTTQVTSPLAKAGLISRSSSRQDRRVAIFRLTKKGRRIFAEMAHANRRWVAEELAALGAKDIARLRDLLADLNHQARYPTEKAA